MPRVLALDHGNVRTGCAVSDPSGTIVRPLPVIEPTDAQQAAALAREQGAERVVVGLPVTLGDEEGEQAQAARSFAEELQSLLEVPVDTYDERLTSKLAQRSAREGASAAEDSLAAAHLLESYLAGGEGQ